VARASSGTAQYDDVKADLQIGHIPGAPAFDGEMADVRLYNRPLEEAEILALVQPGKEFIRAHAEKKSQVTLTLGDRKFSGLLQQPAFLAVRLNAGPLPVKVQKNGVRDLDRVVFTPLPSGHHPNGPKADPHTCSDMWLTGAPLQNPKPGTYNTAGLDQVIALHTKQFCRQPSLVLSIDAGTGYPSRTGTISYNLDGRPIPAENNPRRVFDRLFRADHTSLKAEHEKLQRRIKLVDAVADSARSLDRQLGQTDRERMDQYMTSLNEVESRLIASERWIDIPLKKQDYSHLNLDITNEGDPAEYYRNMFDLMALAFDADITRSITFMLNREDGMGISDTFPLKLGLSKTHHNLSHATDKEGQQQFAKYDLFLSHRIADFLARMNGYQDRNGSVLDNTIVLFGSGASTTHNSHNLPTLVAGGANMGLKHGIYWRGEGETRMSNVHVSILRALGVEQESFSDSTGTVSSPIFTRT